MGKVELYEKDYAKPKHFSFGKNWKRFLEKLDEQMILEAQRSLSEFLGDIRGKRFADVGCGSGLFSLAAHRLGARVTSLDVDISSVEGARHLRKKYAADSKSWKIISMSALSPKISKLGKFDIVYSWGVLHHTGDMKRALENVSNMVSRDGRFFLAIYNRHDKVLFEGSSSLWKNIKKLYNAVPKPAKMGLDALYTAYLLAGITASLKNPFKYVRDYKTLRGMNFFTDVKDWLGGHPYEYASIEEIRSFFSKRGFRIMKIKKARSLGCNEFLMRRI